MLRLTLPLALLLAQGAQKGPVNLDFYDSELGQAPRGWLVPTPGYRAAATDHCAKPARRCAVLSSTAAASPAPFGNLMQYFDATPYRNKQVRFRAAVRVEAAGGARGQLWLRVDRPNGQMGFFENMDNRPITSRDWGIYEIDGEVSEDATAIALGVMLTGGEGLVYIDGVSFEGTGEVEPPAVVERSRPLAGRGLENLIAFARLYGYVRHFYPGDEAAAADWNALAIAGVAAVEGASDPADLARRLAGFFHPVAPTVQVAAGALPSPLSSPAATRMISWKHHGFGTGKAHSVYHSERVATAVPEGGWPQPFLADLGDGVKALVPLALPATGTEKPSGSNLAPAKRHTANDRATRLGAVIIAWNVFQHFYPYFDVVKTDWPKALATALQAAAADRDERDFTLTLRRLVAALKDGHGSVLAGSLGAGAPLAWDWIEDRLVITYVPAAQGQPIERGDTVLAVNGRPVAEALAEIESLTSGATPQWIRWKALREFGLGPPDQPLALEIEPFREPGQRRTVILKRGGNGGASEPRPDKVAELKPGLFYVDLTRINDADWNAALPKLAQASGIVFDLRGYPSLGPQWLTYLSEQPLTSAQWHVPDVTTPDHKNMVFSRGGEWNLSPSKPYLKARRAVLTNGSAISYAESIMGIVEHYRLAEIVGSATAGTNGNVNPINLPGGYTLTWTGMKVLKHDGSQHHGVGIKPTIPVARTRAGVAAGRDELLDRALEAVR